MLFLDTGTNQHSGVLPTFDIAGDLGEPFCDHLLGFHAFTGEDKTMLSRKINPLKKLQNRSRSKNTFQELGCSFNTDYDCTTELEDFRCEIFGYPRNKRLDDVNIMEIFKTWL